MQDTPSLPISGKSRIPVILFLFLIGVTEIMSLLTLLGVVSIPGVRWDIMPSLSTVLTMLSCILQFSTEESHNKKLLLRAIIIGILAFILANIGLRPWAPSILYSISGMAVGIIALAIGAKSIRLRP